MAAPTLCLSHISWNPNVLKRDTQSTVCGYISHSCRIILLKNVTYLLICNCSVVTNISLSCNITMKDVKFYQANNIQIILSGFSNNLTFLQNCQCILSTAFPILNTSLEYFKIVLINISNKFNLCFGEMEVNLKNYLFSLRMDFCVCYANMSYT